MRKYRDVFILITFFILGFLVFKFQGMISQDCLYNFGFANQLYNGHIPYKDYNLVIFPLFAYIMAPFSADFSSFILFSSLFQSIMFTIIMENISNKNGKLIFFVICCLKLWIFPFIDYNMFMIFFAIISYIYLIKYQKYHKSKDLFLTGLFLSLALCSKQSMPGIIIVLITPIILFHCLKEKKYLDFGLYAIGGCLPVFIICSLAVLSGTFYDMLDYALLGVKSFSELAMTQSIAIAFIFSVFLIISIIVLILLTYDLKNGLLSIAYFLPVFIILILKDDRTALFGVMYILALYYILPNKKIEINSKIKSIMTNLTFIIVSVFYLLVVLRFVMVGIGYHQMVENTNYVKTNEYEWISNEKIPEYLFEYIKDIDEYIETNNDKKILPISAFTKLYSLSSNKAFGLFEILVDGNMGVKNFENIPNILEEYDLLLVVNVNMLMQYDGIYEYIEKNYELYEEIPIVGTTGYVYKTK